MSLATRCPHCSTVFKVVQDQLKVSEGWVRCGRCNEVFHALPALFDLDSERPPADAPTPDDHAAGVVTETPPPIDLSEPAPRLPREPEQPEVRPAAIEFDLDLDLDLPDLGAEEPSLEPEIEPEPEPEQPTEPESDTDPEPEPPPSIPSPSLPPTEWRDSESTPSISFKSSSYGSRERKAAFPRPVGPDFADAEFPSDILQDEEVPAQRVITELQPSAPTPLPPVPTEPPAPAIPTQPEQPTFIKQARRQAFWQHPGTRIGLIVLGLLLTASLALQLTHQFRDLIAAHHPLARPYLVQWCEWAGCRLAPPMRLDDLQVESATLTRMAGAGDKLYKLSVVIRNRAVIDLAWPQIELTLTNPNGAIVAKRILRIADAQWVDNMDSDAEETPSPDRKKVKLPEAVPHEHSSTLEWNLRLDGLDPTGYTAEVFYP